MPNIPPLASLRAFEAAARLRSVTKAAEELNVTHPAISHQLKLLEEYFGIPMLQREGRGIKPTPIGERLSLLLTQSFQQIEDFCEENGRSRKGRTLSVASVASFASRWLIPRLPHFMAAYPDIDIRVIYAPHEVYEMRSDCDVAIRYQDQPVEDNEVGVVLFSGESKPLCSPMFLEKYGPIDSAEDIARVPLLHDNSREVWAHWFEQAGVKLENKLTGVIYEDFNLMSTAAIAGHGVALCPVELVRDDIANKNLKVLSNVGVKRNGNYLMVHKKIVSSSVLAFRDWLLGEIQNSNKKKLHY
jgi:LysR family transcriptional regulator, glycine cleavage system transcriptional activator